MGHHLRQPDTQEVVVAKAEGAVVARVVVEREAATGAARAKMGAESAAAARVEGVDTVVVMAAATVVAEAKAAVAMEAVVATVAEMVVVAVVAAAKAGREVAVASLRIQGRASQGRKRTCHPPGSARVGGSHWGSGDGRTRRQSKQVRRHTCRRLHRARGRSSRLDRQVGCSRGRPIPSGQRTGRARRHPEANPAAGRCPERMRLPASQKSKGICPTGTAHGLASRGNRATRRPVYAQGTCL